MKEPTKAQIKEFWKWCGFKYSKVDYVSGLSSELNSTYKAWLSPLTAGIKKSKPLDKNEVMNELPPIDLNNLFKYAVPKLNEENNDLYDIRFTYNRPNGGVTCDINREVDITQAQGDDPALALFWAIYSVLDKSPPL